MTAPAPTGVEPPESGPDDAGSVDLPVTGLPAATAAQWRARLAGCYRGRRAAWVRWLPDGYQRLPGAWRHLLFGRLGGAGRARRPGAEPLLEELPGGAPALRWPGGARCAVCLTHDVDTVDGVPGARRIAALEADLGLRSTFYVPARVLDGEAETFAELAAAGFEIGLHGLRHHLGEADWPENRLADHLDATLERFRDLGLGSYRAPGFATSEALHRVLRRRFRTDSSVPTRPVRSRVQRAPGAGTRLPFGRAGLLTVPASGVPDDTAALRHGAAGVAGARRAQVDRVRRAGGLLVTVDHTEAHLSGGRLFAAAREVLESLAGDGEIWTCRPRDLAALVAATSGPAPSPTGSVAAGDDPPARSSDGPEHPAEASAQAREARA